MGLNKTPDVTTIKNSSKKIVFLGTKHIGTPAYYDHLQTIIAEYQQQNYTFFVESTSRYLGELEKDSLAMKKFRFLFNIDISVKYADMDNPILKSLIKKYNLKNQPSYSELGLKNFKVADVSYPELIQEFERRYGSVKLDSCNISLPLETKYTCNPQSKQGRKLFFEKIVLEYRNQKVSEIIRADSSKKVFIIFGERHYNGIEAMLTN